MAGRVAPAQWFRAALVAAVVAAVCVTVFDLTVSERVVGRAIAAEDSHGAQGALAVPEQFTRGEQQGGLVLAELLYALGAAFVLAGRRHSLRPGARAGVPLGRTVGGGRLVACGHTRVRACHRFRRGPKPPRRSMRGDLTYVSAVLIGAAGCVGAAWIWRRTGEPTLLLCACSRPRRRSPRSAAVVLVALPGDRLVGEVDTALIRDFRLASLISQALFWVACAAGGALALRQPRPG